MTRLADRSFEMVLRNRVRFGVGSIEGLPEIVAAAGGTRVFVVTDPGVQRAGIIDPILDRLAGAGLETRLSSPRSSRTRPLRPSSGERRRCATSASAERSSSPSVAARRWTPRRPSTSGPPTTSPSGSSNTTARTSRPDARSSRSRRPPGPVPRLTASRSSRTKRGAARITSAIPRSCLSRRSWIRA